MAAPAPMRQISIMKPPAATRQGGVLPVPASTTTRNSNHAQKNREVKLKVVVRRLAPGLTEQEFRTALGEEWHVGRGKVDWTSYQEGKIAKDAAKPSRPSRAYLHLTNPQFLGPLADKIAATQFVDAKGSSSDSVLLGPPTLVFTPFNKIPGKARVDGRQGTIDQDPEFIDFLASLTHPIVKPANIDMAIDKENKPSDAKIITPLVQFIKDKKANKIKEGKSQKHGRQESKDNKLDEKKSTVKGGKGKAVAADKKGSGPAKSEKPKAEVPVKVAKPAKASKACSTPVSSETSTAPDAQAPTDTAPSQAKPERRRERGNASMAAKILQRDLALANGAPGRRRRENLASPSASTPQKADTGQDNQKPPVVASVNTVVSVPVAPLTTSAQPTPVPSVGRKTNSQNSTTQQTPSAAARSTPTASSNATQAFLKHANPSQGVTEPLLEEAFKVFGAVTKVEIDKKKGFAYIDFADSSGLQKAIAASPVKVAQGQVVVLERKTGATLQNRNARAPQSSTTSSAVPNKGGRGSGRGRGGRGASNTSKPTNAAPTPVPNQTPVTAPT